MSEFLEGCFALSDINWIHAILTASYPNFTELWVVGLWFWSLVFFFEFFGLGVERGLYVLFSHRFFVTPILQRHLDRVKYRDDWTLIYLIYREKDRQEEIPPWEAGLVLIFPYCAFLHEDKVIAASWLLECIWVLHQFKKLKETQLFAWYLPTSLVCGW